MTDLSKTPDFALREGEEELDFDPARMRADAGILFIGKIRSPWTERAHCPKNVVAARETGQPASVEIDEPFRAGLRGIDGVSHLILLTWLDRGPRNLIVQKPRHASKSSGVFALRSPARPNPVGVHVVGLVDVDLAAGRLAIDAIDVLDGTPLIDVKPYYASTDSVPDARRPRQ